MSRIPCGKTLGHGESCTEGWLCDSCNEITELRILNEQLENRISARHGLKPESNDWIDEWGACKVCGGEIPLGHLPDCAYWKLEQKWNASQSVLGDTVASYRKLEQKLDELQIRYKDQYQYGVEQFLRADDLERVLALHKRTIENGVRHADEMSYLVAERDDEIVCLKDVIDNMETDLDTAITEVLKLRKQLPESMPDCTIEVKSCPVGHTWLTATNWIQHECPSCAWIKVDNLLNEAQVEVDKRVYGR